MRKPENCIVVPNYFFVSNFAPLNAASKSQFDFSCEPNLITTRKLGITDKQILHG